MNQVVYNNRVFYFNSKKYSVDYSKENNKSGINGTNGIKENNVINLLLSKNNKKKEVVAGKGYVAARALKTVI